MSSHQNMSVVYNEDRRQSLDSPSKEEEQGQGLEHVGHCLHHYETRGY